MTDEQILATANACSVMLFRFLVDRKRFEFCLLAFAKQIARLEREACAKVADEHGFYGVSIAQDIRARGEQA